MNYVHVLRVEINNSSSGDQIWPSVSDHFMFV